MDQTDRLSHLVARFGGIGGWRRRGTLVLLDSGLVAAAFFFGYVLRFEGAIPARHLAQFWRFLPWLVTIRVTLNFVLGLHHWSFRFSGLEEAGRLILSTVAGSGVFVTVLYFFQRQAEDITIGPPRSVIVIELLLSTAFMGALRFSPRFALTRLNEMRIARAGERARTVIVGAGSAGELLLRDLRRSDEHRYDVVGFVDDDRSKWASWIGGRPVLGGIDDLPGIVLRRGVEQLLFAIPRAPAALIR
ncbi:MAG TPA: hypothetical protein VMT70_17590, partial [Vicinamibacteria bacterium]|nr:hypothetical protein [Vicinamibacteria bacterium]